jgi:hypothetical protein
MLRNSLWTGILMLEEAVPVGGGWPCWRGLSPCGGGCPCWRRLSPTADRGRFIAHLRVFTAICPHQPPFTLRLPIKPPVSHAPLSPTATNHPFYRPPPYPPGRPPPQPFLSPRNSDGLEHPFCPVLRQSAGRRSGLGRFFTRSTHF